MGIHFTIKLPVFPKTLMDDVRFRARPGMTSVFQPCVTCYTQPLHAVHRTINDVTVVMLTKWDRISVSDMVSRHSNTVLSNAFLTLSLPVCLLLTQYNIIITLDMSRVSQQLKSPALTNRSTRVFTTAHA